jgi:hypothetical protein
VRPRPHPLPREAARRRDKSWRKRMAVPR